MSETWTPERVERLREMAAAGKSGSEIAAVLGVTRNMVIGKATRLRDIQLHGVAKGKERWTDEDLRTLVAMARDGKSAKEVGAAVGRKPDSVYDAAAIRGIKFHSHKMPRPAQKQKRLISSGRGPRGRLRAAAFADTAESEVHLPSLHKPNRLVIRLIAEEAEPSEPGPTIEELKPHHCRFPLWTGRFVAAASRFCGRTKVMGRSWCVTHLPVVFSDVSLEAA